MFQPFARKGDIHGRLVLFALGGRHFLNNPGQPATRRGAIGDAQQQVCRAREMSVAAQDQALDVLILEFG